MQIGRKLDANWSQIDANWTQIDANRTPIEYTIDAICAYEPNLKQKGA